LLVKFRISGVLRLFGVGVTPEYRGVDPPIIGVLSSHFLGVSPFFLSGVYENLLGVC